MNVDDPPEASATKHVSTGSHPHNCTFDSSTHLNFTTILQWLIIHVRIYWLVDTRKSLRTSLRFFITYFKVDNLTFLENTLEFPARNLVSFTHESSSGEYIMERNRPVLCQQRAAVWRSPRWWCTSKCLGTRFSTIQEIVTLRATPCPKWTWVIHWIQSSVQSLAPADFLSANSAAHRFASNLFSEAAVSSLQMLRTAESRA